MSLLPEKRVYASRQIIVESVMELDHALTTYAERYPEERLIALNFVERLTDRLPHAMRWIATWEKTI